MREAGVGQLAYVGGAPRTDVPAEIKHLPDREGGERSALRGVLSALEYANIAGVGMDAPSCVVIIGCDLPMLQAGSIRRLVSALGDNDATVAFGERDHWSCLAIRPTALTALRDVYESGERALHRAIGSVRVARVAVDEHELANVNEPADLARLIADDARDHR